MKLLNSFQHPLLFCFLLLLCCSCDQYFFTNAQPINQEDEKHFPKNLRGVWTSNSDTFHIYKDCYTLNTKIPFDLCIDCNDSSGIIKLKGSDVYILDTTEIPPVHIGKITRQTEDSVYGFINLNYNYCLGKDAILKKVKGGFLLNRIKPVAGGSFWFLTYLKVNQDSLLVYQISSKSKTFIDTSQILFEYAPRLHDATQYSFYDNISNEGFYSTQNWTLDEMNNDIGLGMFSDTIYNLTRSAE
jgi:hypothetical protein